MSYNLCNSFASRSISDTLITLAQSSSALENEKDVYGQGTTLQTFEHLLAAKLGKQAGLFCVTGVMAQQIIIKGFCNEANNNRIGVHTSSHLIQHEYHTYTHLLLCQVDILGSCDDILTYNDILNAYDNTNPLLNKPLPTVIVIELPHRFFGGRTTSWSDLQAISSWCRLHHVKFHCDGARIFEIQPYYNQSLDVICSLFDSVYFSFYKGLGALSGAFLSSSTAYINDCRIWNRRFGGNLYTIFPYVVSAITGYHQNIDTFVSRRHKLCEIVSAVTSNVSNVESPLPSSPVFTFYPETPQACLIHIRFHPSLSSDVLLSARDAVSATTNITVFNRLRRTYYSAVGDSHGMHPIVDDKKSIETKYTIPQGWSVEFAIGPENMTIPTSLFVRGWIALGDLLRSQVSP